MTEPGQPSAGRQDAAARLAGLSDEYFDVVHTTDPFTEIGRAHV